MLNRVLVATASLSFPTKERIALGAASMGLRWASICFSFALLLVLTGCAGASGPVPAGDPPPSIVNQPGSQTVIASQTATFSVFITGTPPFNYEWQKNGVAISGTNSPTYTTPPTTSVDNGAQFTVVITNAAGTTTSNAATLTVFVPPSITMQPINQTVNAGQAATFSVTTAGTTPLSYQWNKNGASITGATTPSYTTAATSGLDNGAEFTVTVSNSAGIIASNAASLTVNVPPFITAQPVSYTAIAGQTATFLVIANGTLPMIYQWQRNGVSIPGATASTYTIAATTAADNGAQFNVIVSNVAGSVSSNAATLTVNVPPSITAQPVSSTVIAGQTATFTVVAAGTPPLTYQWEENGTYIPGATAASYTTPATIATDNGSQFSVIVSNIAGTINSANASLTVNVPPSITAQPLSQTVTIGQSGTFSVTATGTAPLSYQWQENGVAISGATSPTYTTSLTANSDSGSQFTVVVTNPIGAVTSNSATLTVNPPQPIDVVTYHNDVARTGQNLSETILTPSNVNVNTFGKLASFPVDGQVYAQPLYLSNVTIPGQGTHDVLYVATENDSVYAFDAITGAQLWQVSVLGAGEMASDDLGCLDLSPEVGVTATPVIDRTRGPNGAIYVVAKSKDNSQYYQRLHALDITTGAELFGGPTTIQASYPGTGDNSSDGSVIFNPLYYKERAALLLNNGQVYTGWASLL